jgi:hypothetical protein
MYRAHGDGQIDKAYGHLTVDEPFKLDLDSDEFNLNTVSVTPDGDLIVYACIGDESQSSTLYIFRKGWIIKQEEREIPVMEYKEFDGIFKEIRIQYGKYKSGVPEALKKALYQDENNQNK